MSTDELGTLLHVLQSATVAASVFEADAVIGNPHDQMFLIAAQLTGYVLGVGMFADVVHRFLNQAKQQKCLHARQGIELISFDFCPHECFEVAAPASIVETFFNRSDQSQMFKR